MIEEPRPPDAPDGRQQGRLMPRFDDVTQDGRVVLPVMSYGIGDGLWRSEFGRGAFMTEAQSRGILPLLTRLVLRGTPGPFAIDAPVAVDVSYQFAHVGDVAAPEKIAFNVWAELTAPEGQSYVAAPKGPSILAGRAFAEHVFSRPFAPAESRRVTRLGFGGVSDVPPHRYVPHAHSSVIELPDGAKALEPMMTPDSAALALGVGQTDPNQHINSLVYVRAFEQAALRRFVQLGRGSASVPRLVEIAFRKPSFAGESLRVVLRAYSVGQQLGAVGLFVEEKDLGRGDVPLSARARNFVDMRFEE